ncbi:hypothetical protein CYMTET_2920 [Cymbomonas tetramitiformis]|uniref:Uncharacterized protein n=1 Tax=Cymbomonas tetramitiformis TaxID=36881 RepID=A0AAE0H4Q3_9CHLO|nr:hypothetical protein CYMTET_2920 [Cymbomonas tetramitiformis]
MNSLDDRGDDGEAEAVRRGLGVERVSEFEGELRRLRDEFRSASSHRSAANGRHDPEHIHTMLLITQALHAHIETTLGATPTPSQLRDILSDRTVTELVVSSLALLRLLARTYGIQSAITLENTLRMASILDDRGERRDAAFFYEHAFFAAVNLYRRRGDDPHVVRFLLRAATQYGRAIFLWSVSLPAATSRVMSILRALGEVRVPSRNARRNKKRSTTPTTIPIVLTRPNSVAITPAPNIPELTTPYARSLVAFLNDKASTDDRAAKRRDRIITAIRKTRVVFDRLYAKNGTGRESIIT